MLVERNGTSPKIDPTAQLAPTATIVGNVTVAAGCYVDYGVVIASGGPAVTIDEDVIVLANSVIRSTGGSHRPGFPVRVGAETVLAPHVTLAGCEIAERCYIATGAIVLQGALVGPGSRLAVGSVVHAGSVLAPASRVGLHSFAVPDDGVGALITADIELARESIRRAEFFRKNFGLEQGKQELLHRDAASTLRAETATWVDRPSAD